LVVAEISLTPIGTADSSLSFYIAKSIESINDIKGVKHTTTSMGTILEADNMEKIFECAKAMNETIHRLGVKRVGILLKIDSRTDKAQSSQDKLDSVKKHLKSS
jgi:uncharacterized protein (TIGR00106 family)